MWRPKAVLGTVIKGDVVTQTIGLAVALTVFWVLLSGYWLPLIIALGIGSIVLCVVISRRLDVCDHEGHPVHLAVPGLTYFPWLLKEIVVSNIAVAKAIVSGNVRPQVLRVTATQSTELGQTVYANSITLTPGTVTIAEDNGTFVVHALMDETADGLRTGDMDARVTRLMGEGTAAS